jgi:PhnB protein
VFERAITAGATPQVKDQFPESTYWGDRIAQIHDPFGHVWRIQTRIEDVADDELAARFTTQQDRVRAVRAKAPN